MTPILHQPAMTDFNPNDELDTQEQADAYVNWCAENFVRLSQAPKRNYRTAVRCAAWLFVVASAQLHLDDNVEENAEALLGQLVMYQKLGHAIERQRQHFAIERLIVLRASLDCWQPIGKFAYFLLASVKCAVGAMIQIELHPLIDLWELECPDVWAQLDQGRFFLSQIDADELEFADYAVGPQEMVMAKYTWQSVNELARHVGMGPLSPN